jgi:hypothetical protein
MTTKKSEVEEIRMSQDPTGRTELPKLTAQPETGRRDSHRLAASLQWRELGREQEWDPGKATSKESVEEA